VLVNCKRGCEQSAVVDALKARGLWARETPVPPASPGERGRLVATYVYETRDGQEVATKGRFEGAGGKTFLWRLPGLEAWGGLHGMSVPEMPLFGLHSLHGGGGPVYFVEGEKAALACHEHGLAAVCQGGGAAAREIGGLAALQGRPVRLWPDNDAAGHALMARIAVALRGVAATVETVNVPLPEKGDAWDWFALGGTADGITVEPQEPGAGVEWMGEDTIRVRVLGDLGPVSMTFSGITATRREFAAECEVRLAIPGVAATTYSERINLLSSSQRTEMRRDLESIFGKEHTWPRVLNEAHQALRVAYHQVDRVIDVTTIVDPGAEIMLVAPLLPQGVPSVLYGDAGNGKTWVADALMLYGAVSQQFPGAMGASGYRSLLVDYEGTEAVFWRRLRRLALGLGLEGLPEGCIYYWPARGVPLPDLVDALGRAIREHAIDLVVVDSAGEACGGEPEKAEVALAYFRALAGLGCTSLTIAHITKAEAAPGKRPQAPFGSSYWKNTPRRLWYCQATQDEGSPIMEMGLFCTKPGDGPRPSPLGLRVAFDDPDGPVSLQTLDVTRTPELAQGLSITTRILTSLTRGTMTARELHEELGGQLDAVRKALQRLRLKGKVLTGDDGWRLPYG